MTDPALLEQQAAELLAEYKLGSSEFERAVTMLSEAAPGSDSAALRLGHVMAQNPAYEGAADMAAEAYKKAARTRPDGMERLADLYMIGYGVAANDAAAFELIGQVAELGYPTAQCNLAYMHSQGIGTEQNQYAASTLYIRAAAQGDTRAIAVLAERFLLGSGVRQSLAMAGAWIRLAELRKLAGARQRRQLIDSLSTEQQRAKADQLAEVIKSVIRGLGPRVAELEQGDPATYVAQFAQLMTHHCGQMASQPGLQDLDLDANRRMALGATDHTAPAAIKRVLSWQPRVIEIEHFLSPEQCHLLIELATPLLVSTEQARANQKGQEIDNFDGSCAIVASPLATPVSRHLTRRFSELCHLPTDHFEPISVLRYGVAHEYSPHFDYFDPPRIHRHEQNGDFGGQRQVTCLVHLSVADEGGSTWYEHARLEVAERVGLGVIHYNALPCGLPDEHSLHAGLPIKAGEKWLCRTSGREASLLFPQYREIR
ncbi:MAG: hypothetical protein DHS20C11_12060 [Lysobacteraceae bacterium]|nr:MAG: hypothetical protein DHS20C11_12060 [Xanthomonadaceae bacterium]